jgi:NitT/TauT family transport system substrate-binding protein
MGHSGLENTQFAPEFANSLGLYKKYGINDVESFFFDGDGKATQALLAGQVDFNTQGVGNVISSQLTDVPLIEVAVMTNKTSDLFVGAPDIKTPDDLKGKIVAISQFGGESHAEVLLALQTLGLTPDDVTIQQVGSEATRFAALTAGSIAAAPIDQSRKDVIDQQGFHILLDLPNSPVQFVRSGIVMRKDFYEQNPNTVLAIVAASLEAQNRLFTDTPAAIDAFATWTQQTNDRAQAEKFITDYLKIGDRDLRWTQKGFEIIRDVLATQNPAIKDVDVTKAYSFDPLDKLQAMGFDDAIGVPKS